MRNRAGEAIADLTVVWRSGYVAKERKRKEPIHSKIACCSGISRIKMPPPSLLAKAFIQSKAFTLFRLT